MMDRWIMNGALVILVTILAYTLLVLFSGIMVGFREPPGEAAFMRSCLQDNPERRCKELWRWR